MSRDPASDVAAPVRPCVPIKRRPGRPRSDAAKEQINIRLDPDVLALLRQAGPGWQTRINGFLRTALGLPG